VIGIARNTVDNLIFSPEHPFFYVPLSQQYNSAVTLQVRSVAAPEAVAHATTGLIRSLEPGMPVLDVQPMTSALDTLSGYLLFKFAAALAGSLGIVGLILAIIGVYGVISYAASQRTHEMGIRLALGAQPMQILKMILGQGLAIVGAGIIGGVFGAAAMARLVEDFLFGVSPLDPVTYGIATAVLAAVALLACYIPARRVMKVNPTVALHYQ
jgi:putative ABC transport system permease protein